MSRSEAKMRRKVWVNLYSSDGPPFAHSSCREAERAHSNALSSQGEAAIPFLESRPGDVVLSREDVARALALLEESGDEDWLVASIQDIRALLRGGR